MPDLDVRSDHAWNLESLIGSRVLLGAGLVSLLLGAAFFVKLANGEGWVPPAMRIVCGLVAGLALLVGGTALLGKARTYVAEGLTGLGASVLYLSLWGAFGPFHLIDAWLAFTAMIAVSGALALIAWLRSSQNVALAGLAGGFLTPALLVAGPFDHVVLAVYLAVLTGAMLLLAVRCRYRIVEAACFTAALLYAATFAPSNDPAASWTSAQSLTTASVLFAEFALAFIFAARHDRRADGWRLALLAAEVVAYLGVFEAELGWQPHALAFADAALGAVLFAAVAIPLPKNLRATYGSLAVMALTRAIGAWGGTDAVTAALASEGAVIVMLGVRCASPLLRSFGYTLLACGAGGAAVVLLDGSALPPLFNPRTEAACAVGCALFGVARHLRMHAAMVTEMERSALAAPALIGGVLFPLWALSSDVIGATSLAASWTSTTSTALSALWAACAALLIAYGFADREPLARYCGIALFLITVGKAFCIDLWPTLDTAGRTISFLVIGAALVAVAGGYQAALSRGRRASATPPAAVE